MSPTLRKAAVLISALDDRTADALLEQMGPDQAAKVRSALVELDDIPAAEQQAVLAEFMRQQGGQSAEDTDDVSLELRSALEATPPAKPAEATPAEISPLAFLVNVSPLHLARVLRNEQPQTVAVVVANLPPEPAAELLEKLPSTLATESLERLGWLETPTAQVLADVARWLQQQLGPAAANTAGRESLAHHNAVLAALQGRRERSKVAGAEPTILLQRYRLEPARSAPTIAAEVEFDELAQLDAEDLRRVLAAADPQLVLLALTGADERLVARIFRTLPARDAAVLRQRLEHPGPIRLREIEQAQRELAAVAARLARNDQITLPNTARFAAAA